jgi:hypothetical protein
VENLHKHSLSFKKTRRHIIYAFLASSFTYGKRGEEYLILLRVCDRNRSPLFVHLGDRV